MTPMDPHLVAPVCERLGPVYRELLEVMLDLATPPIFLIAEDRSRFVEVRERARSILEDWASEAPALVAALADQVPELLREKSNADSLLVAATWNDFFTVPESILTAPDPTSRTFEAVPQLLSRLDDDGLVDMTDLDAQPHGLLIGEYSLHYHQLLRRGFQSNVHYGLIEAVLGVAAAYGARARLAVDGRRLRMRAEHQELIERDYWYGPPLSESALDDVHLIGETFHGDPKEGRSIVNPYAGLSVRWTSDGPLKTVQVEELMPTGEAGEPWVLARYLHAIRDTEQRAFIHCDGAVKAYDPTIYPTLQRDFEKRGRGQHYRKVFRLDGIFPANAWSALLGSWFRGNQLVQEYLSGFGSPEDDGVSREEQRAAAAAARARAMSSRRPIT